MPACLGKLPLHGDFIRWHHSEVPEIVEFDGWLQEGMERAYEARGRAFEQVLRTLPTARFLYTSPRTGGTLAGALRASQDQVGRRYPFTLAFRIADAAPGPAFDRLPLATAPLLQRAHATLAQDLAGVALPAFLEQLQGLAADLDDNTAAQDLRSYLFGTTVDQLFSRWPGFVAPARRTQFEHELRQVSSPPFPPRYVVALPCSGDPGEVAFWLSLLRQWLPVRGNPTLVLWPDAGADGGQLRLLFDALAPRYAAPALWPQADTAERLDLGRNIAPRADQVGSVPWRGRALLQDVILAAGRE